MFEETTARDYVLVWIWRGLAAFVCSVAVLYLAALVGAGLRLGAWLVLQGLRP